MTERQKLVAQIAAQLATGQAMPPARMADMQEWANYYIKLANMMVERAEVSA